MRKLMLIIMVIGACTGCLPPKQTVKSVDYTDLTVEAQASSQKEVELTQEVEQSVKRMSEQFFTRLSELELSRERREYSRPDSAGRQYLIVEENSRLNRRDSENGEREDREDVEYKAVTEQLARIAERQESLEKTIRNLNFERKARLSWWQSMLLFVGALSVAYVSVRIYTKIKRP